VLVIEDDRDIALGIRTVLTRSGFDVANSRDGKQGLRVFHTTRPDLVVLDIGLPTLDGWQVLERIRDLSDVPVLILTAHGTPMALTPIEYRLLAALVRHPGRTLPPTSCSSWPGTTRSASARNGSSSASCGCGASSASWPRPGAGTWSSPTWTCRG
jgi:DNA-binding response OmpR family regulator